MVTDREKKGEILVDTVLIMDNSQTREETARGGAVHEKITGLVVFMLFRNCVLCAQLSAKSLNESSESDF